MKRRDLSEKDPSADRCPVPGSIRRGALQLPYVYSLKMQGTAFLAVQQP